MKRTVMAALLLSMAAFLVGCAKQLDQASAVPSRPESAPAPQAAAETTAGVADSCFTGSTESQEQDRIDFAEGGKEVFKEGGTRDLTTRAIGDHHEVFIFATLAPSWSPQVRAVAQEWLTEFRRDWFIPKFQKATCDMGFSKVGIVVMVPKPSGGPDLHLIYNAFVTKRGFVPVSATDLPPSE